MHLRSGQTELIASLALLAVIGILIVGITLPIERPAGKFVSPLGGKPDSCLDTDQENNPYVKGRVYGHAGGIPYSIYDSCQDNQTLLERFCSDAQKTSKLYTCPQSCFDGICLGKPEPAQTAPFLPSPPIDQPKPSEPQAISDEISAVTWYRNSLPVANPEIGILPIDQQFSEKGPAIVKNEIKLPSTETLRTTDEGLFEEILIKAGIEYTKQDLVDYVLSPEIPVLVSYDSPVVYYPQKRKDFELRQAAGKLSLQASIASLNIVEDLSSVPENAQTISNIKTIVKQKGATFGLTFKSVAAVSLKTKRENLRDVAASIKSIQKVNGLKLDSKVRTQLNNSIPIILGMNRSTWDSHTLYGYNGSGIKIAIIDTGINKSHLDLDDLDDNPATNDPKVIAEADFTGGTTGPADLYGHGTHVASIAAGTGQASNYKFVGVAPQAYLLNGKVLSDQGSGFESWIVSGIEWAVVNNANVISMSVGGLGRSPIMEEGVRQAVSQGVPVVVAAGNAGPSYFTINTPGVTKDAITVGASNNKLFPKQPDNLDSVADFSSRGLTKPDYILKPDVVAPGVNICAARAKNSLFDIYLPQNCGNPEYLAISGTSMATPHVAGAVALMLQANPSWTPKQIKSALMGNSVQLYRSKPFIDYYLVNVFEQGAGRLILKNSIHSNSFTEPASINLGVISPTQTSFSTAFNLSFNKSGNIGYVLKDFAIKIADPKSYNTYPIGINEQGCISSPATIPFSGNIASLPTDFFAGHLNLTIYSDCSFTQKIANITIPISFGKLYNLTINVTWPNVYLTPGESNASEFHLFLAQFIDKNGNWIGEFVSYIFDENQQIRLLIRNESFDANILLFTTYVKSLGPGFRYKYKHASFVRNVSIPPSGSTTISIDERDAKRITFNKPNIITQGNYTNYSAYPFLSRPCKYTGGAPNARCGLPSGTELRSSDFDYEFALDPTDVSPEYRFEGSWGGIKDFNLSAIFLPDEIGKATDFAFLPFTLYYPFSSLDIEIPASELAEIKFELDNPFKKFAMVGMAMAVYSEFLPFGVGIWNEISTVPKTKKYIIRNATCENCHYFVTGLGRTKIDGVTPFEYARVERWDDGPPDFDLTKHPVNNPPLKSHYAIFKPPFKVAVLPNCTSWYWIACYQKERGLFGEFLGLQENSLPFYYSAGGRGYLNVTWPATNVTQESNIANYGFIWAISCFLPSFLSWPPELKNITCNTGNYSVEWKTQDVFKTQTPCAFATAYHNGSQFNVTYLASGEVNEAGQCIPLVGPVASSCSLVFNPVSPIAYGTLLNASCSCSNPEAGARLFRDGIDVSSENNVFVQLGANTYSYECNVTATQNYTSATTSSAYIVNQAATVLTVAANPGWGVTYNTLVNVSCYANNNQVSVRLYRNGVDVSGENGVFVDLGAGGYGYECNNTATQNYTSASVTNTLDIAKASTTITLFLNNIQDNLSITYLVVSNASAYTSASSVSLYRDNAIVTNPEIVTLGAGYYNYTAITPETANYSSSSETLFLNVSKGLSLIELYLNRLENNLSVTYPALTNASAYTNIAGVQLYRDDLVVINPEITTLGAGYYNYTAINDGNENYTDSRKTLFANVSKVVSSCSLLFNPVSPIIYGPQINASCSCDNPESSARLFRGGVDVSGENSVFVSLGAGSYSYECNVTGTQNYTQASNSSVYVINQADNPVSLYLNNNLNQNVTISYGMQSNASGYSLAGAATLYRDGLAVSNPEIDILAAGLYAYKINATGNQNYTDNSTGLTFYSNVTKIVSSAALTILPPSPITYGTSTNAACSDTNPEAPAKLFRNDVDVSGENGLYVVLAAGIYNYVCNVSEAQNYTSTSTSLAYQVNRASHTVHLALNNLESDLTVTYPTQTTATGWQEISEGFGNLYRNGILIVSGVYISDTAILGAAVYDYTFFFQQTENYTEQSITRILTVNAAFVCGDANDDNKVDLQDIIYLVNYIFKGGPQPIPDKLAGDANGDDKVNLQDIIYLVNYIFKGGPKPCASQQTTTSETASYQLVQTSSSNINLNGNLQIPVAGLQLELLYDPAKLTVFNVTNTSRTRGLSIVVDKSTAGRIKIGVYDLSGSKAIPSGSGTLLTIRFSGNPAGANLRISSPVTVEKKALEMKTSVLTSKFTTTTSKTIQPIA